MPVDLKEATKLYRQAADQGDAGAQSNLGLCYEHGKGVPADMKEATKLYRQAAAQGHADAKQALEDINAAKGKRL